MQEKTAEQLKVFDFSPFEKRNAAKSLLPIFLSWILIGSSIYATLTFSYWLYPLAVLLIANRQLALMLLSHEALHGNLLKNKPLNNFIGTYLCAFPTFISFYRYRMKHLAHHAFLNTSADPDRGLYAHYPTHWSAFFHPRVPLDFIKYYTDLTDFRSHNNSQKNSMFSQTDFKSFLTFHIFIIATVIYFKIFLFYILFWIIPEFISLPYFLFMGGLQHGPVTENPVYLQSRTVTGAKLWMELLLPVNINFHAEHHLRPTVPQYNLRSLSEALQKQNIVLWRESYKDSVRALFN